MQENAAAGKDHGNEAWYLTLHRVAGTQSLIQRVAIRDSNASNGQAIMVASDGSDLGNNVNWGFPPVGTLILLRQECGLNRYTPFLQQRAKLEARRIDDVLPESGRVGGERFRQAQHDNSHVATTGSCPVIPSEADGSRSGHTRVLNVIYPWAIATFPAL